jgi:hypothetical protein
VLLDQLFLMQRVEMMGEGGRRDAELLLELARDHALGMRGQEEAHDLQPDLVTERGEPASVEFGF